MNLLNIVYYKTKPIIYRILFFFLLSILFNCSKDTQSINPVSKIIEGKTFNSTLFIDGHFFDNTIIRDCAFENIDGDGLQIRNVNNLTIENCIFRNIEKDAIRFRNSGASENVEILNNEIYNIKENGILAAENHINTKIIGNKIYNVAIDNISSQFGAPHHGIYFQGANFEISNNIIYNVINDNGNCISVRTYGTISKNRLYNANKRGISYFSNHPGFNGELLIENNFIYDNGKRAIHLASDGTTQNHIGNAIIRFNTIFSDDLAPLGIDDQLIDVSLNFYGNIIIRLDGGSNFIFTNLPYEDGFNLVSNSDIGFSDFQNRDLHINGSSIAKNYAVGLVEFPEKDIDGDVRTPNNLDAGADEINQK